MKIRSLKLILAIFLFLLAGELIIRFDEKFKLFEQDNIVRIKTEMGESDEMTLLKNNLLSINDKDLRILVLGDSYIYGAGIDRDLNFSHQLKKMLSAEKIKKFETVYILDVSRPSNNTLDNYNTYFSFVKLLKPQIVILGYNLNDLIDREKTIDSSSLNKTAQLPDKVIEGESTVKKIYNILYASELLQFTLHNTNKYLKSKGIIIPNSVFGQELSDYFENKPDWQYSKELLTNMILHSETVNSKFIVLLVPEIDLIKYRKLFSRTDKVINEFFQQFSNVRFLNLRDSIDINKGEEYILSRYDEHPNEKGHQFMAEIVHRLIIGEINTGSEIKK
jgi:lysophospholipase L1-like esterase